MAVTLDQVLSKWEEVKTSLEELRPILERKEVEEKAAIDALREIQRKIRELRKDVGEFPIPRSHGLVTYEEFFQLSHTLQKIDHVIAQVQISVYELAEEVLKSFEKEE